MAEKFGLERFTEAQSDGVYEKALAEIGRGRKTSHWMWFIFPQLAGLGSSPMAAHYAIRNAAEAREYLSNPLLGGRLREICNVLIVLSGSDAHAIFGSPDDLKLRSSMTLFDYVAPGDIFAQVLAKYYGGRRDERSLEMLKAGM